MEYVALFLVLVAGLVSSAPIESGARGETAEIEKKNFIPLPNTIHGTLLRGDGKGVPWPIRRPQNRYGQQQQQQQMFQDGQYQDGQYQNGQNQYGQYQYGQYQPYQQQQQQQQGLYNDEGGDCMCARQFDAYNPHVHSPQEPHTIDLTKCPCHPNANGRPFYPYHALPNQQGAPNVIDLRHLLSGRLERPPHWPWGVHRQQLLQDQKGKKLAAKKPSPPPVYKPPAYAVKNGYGYTGWTKTAIPKRTTNPWGFQPQRMNYMG